MRDTRTNLEIMSALADTVAQLYELLKIAKKRGIVSSSDPRDFFSVKTF